MTTLRELLHWIVALIGVTETLLILLVGVVWLIYLVWNRRPSPPRGIWRWGTWIPMVFCLDGVRRGVALKWELYDMMMTAGAFNEPQADLYLQRAVFGTVRLLLVGIVGTIFIRATVRGKDPRASVTSPTNTEKSAVA